MATQEFTPEEIESEEWRDIPGYEGIYQVSNLGRVKSMARQRTNKLMGTHWRKEKLLSPGHSSKGYLHVTLYKGGNRTIFSVHNLVLSAFKEEPDFGETRVEANHLDGDKTNNRLKNLEYTTPSENRLHSYHELGNIDLIARGEKSGNSKVTAEEVMEIRKLYESGEYLQKELGEMYGIHKATVGDIVRRETWKHLP